MPVTTRAATAMKISEMEAAKALLELKRGMGLTEQPASALASRPRRKGANYSSELSARRRDSQ
jgi:hypothetical protein